MPADQYPIFCELMKFGIFGRVMLSEKTGTGETVFSTQVSVRLQLEDMTTNMLQIAQAPPPPPANPDDPPGQATLSLTNLLNYPVQVPSLTLNLLDKGDQSGMILAAENLQLLPGGTQLLAQSDAGHGQVSSAQRLRGDTTVVELDNSKCGRHRRQGWPVNEDNSAAARVQSSIAISAFPFRTVSGLRCIAKDGVQRFVQAGSRVER
jgi:hypothetical protein